MAFHAGPTISKEAGGGGGAGPVQPEMICLMYAIITSTRTQCSAKTEREKMNQFKNSQLTETIFCFQHLLCGLVIKASLSLSLSSKRTALKDLCVASTVTCILPLMRCFS